MVHSRTAAGRRGNTWDGCAALLLLAVLGVLGSPRISSAGSGGTEDFFPRGDATCEVRLSAADVVAAVRGLGGLSVCGNDDCDRDGEVTPVDVDCSARCLFGTCPVPPHAPRVSEVVAESAPSIVPLSLVRIRGGNFGSAEQLQRVSIGGAKAEMAEFVARDSLLVAVPSIEPGPAEVIVFAGDLAGEAFPIEVFEPAAIGEPDTFDGAVLLLIETIRIFQSLNLQELYAERTDLVNAQLDDLVEELAGAAQEIATNPAIADEERQALDAALEASGIPEFLRDGLSELQSGEGALARSAPVSLLNNTVIGGLRGVASFASAASATPLGLSALGQTVLVLGGVAVTITIVAGVLAVRAGAFTPIMTNLTFRDADGETQARPTAAGTVRVEGFLCETANALCAALSAANGATVRLVIQNAGSEITRVAADFGPGFLEFEMPDAVGACDTVRLFLRRAGFASNFIQADVQPELLDLFLSSPTVTQGDSVDLLVRGVAGCPKSAVWRFSLLDTFSPRSDLLVRNLNLFQTRVPNLAQGQSGVFVEMPFTQLTTNPRFVEYDSGIRDLVITCGDSGSTPSLIELPPGESVFCQVAPVGGGGEPKPFPRLLDLEWRSSDSSVVTAGSGFCCEEGCGRGDPPDDCCRCGRIGAADLGAATISVVALSAGREFARSSQGVDVEVVELDLPDLPLNGIVRSEADDSPIAGARIRILDFDRSLITSTTSEADGTFSVEVRSGLVTVSVSADGFGQAEQEVEVGPLEPPLVTIVLLRTSEDTFGINGTVMELTADSARRPVDGATVTVLISPSTPIGLAVTDGDGHYELRVPLSALPVTIIARASKAGFAVGSQRARLLGPTDRGIFFELHPVNPECQSDLDAFEIIRSRTVSGASVSMGEVPFEGPGTSNSTHPSASVTCLSGDPATPTITWNTTWVGALIESVFRVNVTKAVSPIAETLFSLFPNQGEQELLPPIFYGELGQGRLDTPISDAVPLQSDGTQYAVSLFGQTSSSVSPQTTFRVRP